MIELFNRERRRIAVLERAFAVSERQRLNALWELSFSLPADDPKLRYCKPFQYVRRTGGELYRIMPNTLSVNGTGSVAFQCEHVLATLIDNVLFGYHVVGNQGVYTEDVIRYVLERQIEKNWVLWECDFHNQYEYGWEQETLLSALFSIAAPLPSPMWVTDTGTYPWRLSLKRLEADGPPELYVRRRHNLTGLTGTQDPRSVVTRIYPLGYGEGVNQLGIAAVNGGVPYLQSPREITDRYGIIERVWVDRRYEDPLSLKAAAQNMLTELQQPPVSYSVGFQELDASDYDRASVGKRMRIICPELSESVDTVVTEVSRIYDDATASSLTVADRAANIADSVSDMADRQRIEQTYSQGATQIYAQTLQANCDSSSGAVMDFFIPEEMRIVNKILAKIRVSRFRAYSRTTESSRQQNQTSGSGGGSTATSSSGGGATSGATELRSSNVDPSVASGQAVHNHGMPDGGHIALVNTQRELVGWADWVPSGAHTHPAHSHEIQAHSHTVIIPEHSHTVDIPAHAHSIAPGIFEFGSPGGFSIFVNGARKTGFTGLNAELDVTSLLTGADGRIPRGSWLSLEVRPDDLAYVSLDLIVQGFIQSRGDKTV